MRIILDTDKKTITVPWNYQAKLDSINEIIVQARNKTDKSGKPFLISSTFWLLERIEKIKIHIKFQKGLKKRQKFKSKRIEQKSLYPFKT